NKENSRNFLAGARPLFLSRDIRWISWKSIGQNAIGYALRSNETELPRHRAEAQEIRARRHAYERLPGSVKTEMNELEVFRAFEAVADIGIDAGSAQNAKAPEPDIWCAIDGNPHYFELGEIADTSVAHNLAKALERDEPTGGAFSQMEPFHDILTSKLNSRVVPLWWIVRSRVTLSAKGPLRQAIHEQDHRLADRKRAEHDPQIAFMNLRSGRGARHRPRHCWSPAASLRGSG
ncbi:MAG: hypothetical protein DMG59_26380, partial [Acidobacteria bacterium]